MLDNFNCQLVYKSWEDSRKKFLQFVIDIVTQLFLNKTHEL